MALRCTCDPRSSVCSFLVHFVSLYMIHYEWHRDYFRLYSGRNIWGNLKIKLLDTLIWPQLRDDPDRYDEQYRKKQKLVEYDFLVIPMFEE